jgi:phage-related tail protein
MKRLLPLPVFLLMIGCMSSITERFDSLSQRMGDTNEQIRQMNAKLDETNLHLTHIEQSMKKLTGEGNAYGGAPSLQRP